MLRAIFYLFFLSLLSCGYHMGYNVSETKNIFRSLEVPVFSNKTQEAGAEVYFTSEFKKQISKSRMVKISPQAPFLLKGVIRKIKYESVSKSRRDLEGLQRLPDGVVLTTRYRVSIEVLLKLIRKKDRKKIWERVFEGEGSYAAPRLETEQLNSVNALYNHSARHKILRFLAEEKMEEAHETLFQSF